MIPRSFISELFAVFAFCWFAVATVAFISIPANLGNHPGDIHSEIIEIYHPT